MPGGYLYGWDPVGEGWVKVVCNPDGELDIDATAIFENPPTEDEAAKGPSSEWAFDHKADVDAHHAKYTDVESRAAIGDKFNSVGTLASDLNCGYHSINSLFSFIMRRGSAANNYLVFKPHATICKLVLAGYEVGGGSIDTSFYIYHSAANRLVIHTGIFQAEMALYLENEPTNDEITKAPTSNWAFDHVALSSAHHPRYTDSEAIAAAAVYEDIPTDGETGKAPTSNWAFDHDADVDAHHAKYTNAEAIAAAAVYENPPTEDEAAKAPTSEWAFDHDADVSAHHVKYTDAEAQEACQLDGVVYQSISGVKFKPHAPDTVSHIYTIGGSLKIYDDTVNVYCPVELPSRVTVSAVKVDGNAGASSETWTMYRVALSDQTKVAMASAAVGTEDTSISYATINNGFYVYFISIPTLMANDEIHSVRIAFSL